MSAEDVAAQLTRFGVDQQSAIQMLTSTYASMGASAQMTGDQVLRMTQLFGPGNASQLAMVVGRLGGVAATTNTPLSQLLALAGQAGQMLPGRGMMMFTSLIQELNQAAAQGKSDIDFSHGLLGGLMQLRKELAGMSGPEKIDALHDMGVSASRAELDPVPQPAGRDHPETARDLRLGRHARQSLYASHRRRGRPGEAAASERGTCTTRSTRPRATVNRWLGELSKTTQNAAGAAIITRPSRATPQSR